MLRMLLLVLLSSLTNNLDAQPLSAFPLTQLRQEHRLPMPAWEEALADSCRERAVELAQTGVLTHDKSGQGPAIQLLGQGFPPGRYGEVLGAGADPEKVWAAWMASPTHRQVLLDSGWTSWGAASTSVGQSRVWVLRFRGP